MVYLFFGDLILECVFLGFVGGRSNIMIVLRIYMVEIEKLLKEKGLKCVCELCDCG